VKIERNKVELTCQALAHETCSIFALETIRWPEDPLPAGAQAL